MFKPTIIVLIAALGLAGCASNHHAGSALGPVASELAPGAVIHYVRIQSGLPDDEAMVVLHRRAERFRQVPGLLQKLYGRDADTGEFCGIYIFESQAALETFRTSELALTIREAYEVESARIERYDVLFTLHPGLRAR